MPSCLKTGVFRTGQLVLLTLFLLGCASSGKKERDQLRKFISLGQWSEALELVEESETFSEEKSKLLGFLEKGLLHHAQGNYLKSNEELNKAQELSRKLFTTSLSAASKTLVANDSYDLYYGAPYERSLIHFYKALNSYLLYQNELSLKGAAAERAWLYSARAELVAWDSLLNEYSIKDSGFGLYRNDLLAKVFGGLIHESFETRDESQVALQLYKDAYDVLIKHYNTYPSFNQKFKSFSADYEKLSSFKKEEVQKNYIEPTHLQKDLKTYIQKKILELTLRLYPRDKKNVVANFAISDELISQVENEKASNVVLLVQRGLIPEKVGSKQYIGLDYAEYESEAAQVLSAIGAGVLSFYAQEKLGLHPAPEYWNPAGAQLGFEVSHALVRGIGFAFELPEIKNSKTKKDMRLTISKNDEQVEDHRLPLVQPLGDMAEQAVARDALSRYARVGGRLLVKHLTALAASYGTYQALSSGDEKGDDQFALSMATLQYVAASKAIEKSEQADTRYWSGLPGEIRLLDLYLRPGEYNLSLSESDDEGHNREIDLGVLTVPKNEKGKVFHNLFIP